MPETLRRLVRIARYAWASPASLVGLFVTAWVLLRGGSVRARAGTIEAILPGTARKQRLPFDAITLGHVIVGRSERQLDGLFAHEFEHVRQYERWGPVFFLAYPVSSLLQVLHRRNPYRFNHFEVQARQRSARKE